jgi:hypothetical protein
MTHNTPTQRLLNEIAMVMFRTPYDNLDPISMEAVDFRYFEEMEREAYYMMEQIKEINTWKN